MEKRREVLNDKRDVAKRKGEEHCLGPSEKRRRIDTCQVAERE
jgi:hypothetical protein